MNFDRFPNPKSTKNLSKINQQIIPATQQPQIQKCLKKIRFCILLATSAISCYVENLIKMLPTSFQKQLSNQHPNLNRFWSQLGTNLGGFWGPRWSQDGTKSLQQSIFKTIKKMITFWIASRSIFDRSWEPK